jgi:hypothetical protein
MKGVGWWSMLWVVEGNVAWFKAFHSLIYLLWWRLRTRLHSPQIKPLFIWSHVDVIIIKLAKHAKVRIRGTLSGSRNAQIYSDLIDIFISNWFSDQASFLPSNICYLFIPHFSILISSSSLAILTFAFELYVLHMLIYISVFFSSQDLSTTKEPTSL